MGFYFRKSISSGPYRLNFSKSGIGMSFGVKGARISWGPRGTYLNVGRHGLYYREKLSPSKTYTKRSYQTQNINNYSVQITPEKLNNILDENQEITYDLINQIKKRKRLSILIVILLILICILLINFFKIWGFLASLLVFFILSPGKVRIYYDLDKNAYAEWVKFITGLSVLCRSQKIWTIESAKNRRLNGTSFSVRDVDRKSASVCYVAPNKNSGIGIRVDVPTFLIKTNRYKFLFLPDGVIVKTGNGLVGYTYNDIYVSTSIKESYEHNTLCTDAYVIRRYWLHACKDGSRDLRYKYNPSIPLCRYGEFCIKTAKECIEFRTSNVNVVRNIETYFVWYRKCVNTVPDEKKLIYNEDEYSNIDEQTNYSQKGRRIQRFDLVDEKSTDNTEYLTINKKETYFNNAVDDLMSMFEER